MGISADQQATLQLLLERGQSYGDLATLLGQDEAEVRARARGALTELGGADPDRSVGLTDYLLGQADPIGRADVSRHLREDPADHQLATELAEALRARFPAAELPRLPGEPRSSGRRRRAHAEERERTSPLEGLPGSQPRLIAIAGVGALLLLFVVLAVAGVFDGGEDEPTAATTTDATAAGDEQVVPIALTPTQGTDAGGAVIFGFATADQPFVEFQIRQLQPAPQGKTYVLWFLVGGGEAYPLPTPLEVSPDGSLSDRVSVPPEVIAVAEQAESIVIALNDTRELNRQIDRIISQGGGTLEFPGGTVLSADLTRQEQGTDGAGGSGSGN